jgi:RHS repeat-associated protein
MGYDANGNMTTRGADTLSYDSENRLKEMKIYEGESGSTQYTLKPGWNVISFTHLPDNRSVSSILSSLTFGTDYDQVSTWDSSSGSWKQWVNDADFNDFTTFDYGKTYEIYNKSGVDKSFTVTGKTRGTDITHSIVSGDNFISPAVKTATNVSTVLSSLTFGTHYSDVKRFNATSQTWESYASSQFTQFEPGKGYNIIGLTSASFSYGKTEITTTFVYDSTGSRVKKTSGSSTTIYLGKDYDVTGSLTTKYIFLGDRRISTKKSDGTLEFVHSDHINSSNVITDSSGNQSGLLEYDPYGSTVTHTGSANPKHKFTGQEEDSTTRLYYYGARYMDPQLGRFITADPTVLHPFDPQDLNRYAYARNNPIVFTDPTGLGFFTKLLAIAGAVIGAMIGFAVGGPPGAVAGAFIGGTIGGAMGGVIDAQRANQNLLRGAMWGGLEGFFLGGAVAGGLKGDTRTAFAMLSTAYLISKTRDRVENKEFERQIEDLGQSEKAMTVTVNSGATSLQHRFDDDINRLKDALAEGPSPGLPFSDLPSGGGLSPGPGTAGSVVPAANVRVMQAGLATDLAGINSGRINLRGEGGEKKRTWFDKLFGRKGILNRGTWFRIGLGWKQLPGAPGREVFRIASGGKNQAYHLHIDFEEGGISTDFKWNG